MYRYHYSFEIKSPHSTNYNITVLKVMPCSLADTYQFSFKTLAYIYTGGRYIPVFPSKTLPTSTQEERVVFITAPIH
jgi:hypothetical protein